MTYEETIQAPLLMTPGPSRVPDPVLRAGALPMIHHRTPEFSRVLADIVEGMRMLFQSSGSVLPVHTTGRGAMEASVCNILSPGDELIACCNGKFGEMWAGIAETYGIKVHRVCTDWNRDVDPSEVADALDMYLNARALTVAFCDTSTGVLNNIEAVCALTRNRGVFAMVDCVAALGGAPFEFDRWGADVAVTASQKCLMCSPGMAFVAVSDRIWKAVEESRFPRSYWDFKAIRKTLSKSNPETPGTAPVHLMLQLRAALGMMREEGLANVFGRHELMGRMVRERTAALGLSLQYPKLKSLSPTVTAIAAPEGVDSKIIRARMKERGILIAGTLGPDPAAGFRIGHLGDIHPVDVQFTLDALAQVLHELNVAPSARA